MLRPAVVVRSYGGSAKLDRQLEAMGIKVVQLGYAGTLADVRSQMLRAGAALGAGPRAAAMVKAFDTEVAAAHQGGGHAGTALYITPGDVTTGPGSLVAEVIEAAGFTPYRTRPGWGSLPIEGGVEVAYKSELEAAEDPAAHLEAIRERLNRVRSPFRTAEKFGVEDIIDPRDTRPLLCEFAELAWRVLD